MHFSLKPVFSRNSSKGNKQIFWRRFFRILMLHKREKRKNKLSSQAEFNIVHFRLSQHPAMCHDCQVLMGSHIALYQHCRTQHPESLVNALCCDAEFYTSAALAAHCESAHMGQHICIRCCMFFESFIALKNHLSEHGPRSEAYAYFCIVCGTFKNSTEEIKGHLRSEHEVDDGKEAHYVCRVPQLALEMTSILEKADDHDTHPPTLKDCMSYTLHGQLQAT